MTPQERHDDMVKEKAKEMFDQVDVHIREDLAMAVDWASDMLMRKEGEGHMFQVHSSDRRDPGKLVCTFSKASWGGEHRSYQAMELASEAVVMATCEYLVGG